MKLKSRIWANALVILAFLSITLVGCVKENVPSETVPDEDGNVYSTVTIGSQVWMAQNLRTTKYRNGNLINNITSNQTWSGAKDGAYCNYNNNVNQSATYGRLYNWYAVHDPRNIAPDGWHIPTDDEWKILEKTIGGFKSGGKLKDVSSIHWDNPNTGANNKTGFSALPSGYRSEGGEFLSLRGYGNWWSASEMNDELAWGRTLSYDNSDLSTNHYPKACGLSIRCVKD